MGFFKDMRQLNKVANEQRQNRDVGATMANAQKQMVAGQEIMAERTKMANAQASGIPATVTVSGIRELSEDGLPGAVRCDVDFTVIPQGLPPYPLTMKCFPGQIKFAFDKPAPTMAAKVDPADPTAIWIDYSGTGV